MGRPVTSQVFGPDTNANSAVITYDTDGNAVTADGTVNEAGEITVNIVSGGSGYTDNTTVQILDAGGGTFDIDFTVSGGAITAGTASNLSGTINDAQSGTSLGTQSPQSPLDFQILGLGNIPGGIAGGEETVYISRQKSETQFVVTSIANGDSGICTLTDAKTITPGLVNIVVNASDGMGGLSINESAQKITNRKVRTFAGNTYVWKRGPALNLGEAKIGEQTV